MGVWIETKVTDGNMQEYVVTPFVGVWIETCKRRHTSVVLMSHPSWVCGLKQYVVKYGKIDECHTLRGCVD